ncbi:MAG: class I SAM-dependent RNA methyltransferase [Myxococcota bacterium]|nr:class I SAM-dependent RNA methyltransferase [Myxococcota bacterium]
MSKEYRLVATCPEETKDALLQELVALGVRDVEPLFRAVSFTADEKQFYEAHLRLRTPSSILRVLKVVAAKTPVMLYSQVQRINWPELFDAQHSFRVEVVGADQRGPLTSKAVLTQVREAVREVFQFKLGKVPKIDADDGRVTIVAFMDKGRCTLGLDTTGKSLHKRGYRESGHPAVIKETLAASLLVLAGYDGTKPFMDPMCGSGTIAIEAALMAVKRPPLLLRKKGDFAFEWHKDFNRGLWREVQESARAGILEQCPVPLVASDVEAKYVAMTQKSALTARVERNMTFATQRMQDVTPPAESGVLVTNLPYDERLAVSNLTQLYEEIGDTLKQRFAGWRAALLVVEASPHKFIGLKTTQRIPILNGNIPCKLLIFDLYAGSKRA